LKTSPTSALADAALQEIVAQLPDECRWAKLSVAAEADGDQLQLSVQMESTETVAAEDSVSAELLQRMTRFYFDCAKLESPWSNFSAVMKASSEEDWAVESHFEYPDQPVLQYQPSRRAAKAPMSPALLRVFHRHAAMSLDKHFQFDRILGSLVEWNFDAAAGALRLCDGREFPVEPIGVFCNLRETWHWASDLPETLHVNNPAAGGLPHSGPQSVSAAASCLKHAGDSFQIPELLRSTLTLDEAEPDCLALAACGICEADFWFECDGPEDSVFLIGRYEEPPAIDQSPDHAAYVLLELFDNFQCDHALTTAQYLEQLGYQLHWDNGDQRRVLTATAPSGEPLSALFDADGVLRELILDQ